MNYFICGYGMAFIWYGCYQKASEGKGLGLAFFGFIIFVIGCLINLLK